MAEILLPCLFAFIASGGFAVIYNIHSPGILICAFGGGLGWLIYLLSAPLLQSDIAQTLAAAVVVAGYAEVMARLRKCPVTGYLLVAIFPMVPGAGVYYTMEHAINGENQLFLDSLLHTLGLAGAIAVGVLLVSSLTRMVTNLRHHLAAKKEGRP